MYVKLLRRVPSPIQTSWRQLRWLNGRDRCYLWTIASVISYSQMISYHTLFIANLKFPKYQKKADNANEYNSVYKLNLLII